MRELCLPFDAAGIFGTAARPSTDDGFPQSATGTRKTCEIDNLHRAPRGAIVFNQGERWQFWSTGFAVRFEVEARRDIFLAPRILKN